MSSAKFKFYVNAILKEIFFADLLRRDENFDILDINDNVYEPKTPSGTTDLNITGAIWFKEVDGGMGEPNTLEMYYGSLLLAIIDRDNGNLIYGLGDIDNVPLSKGGTGATTAAGARTALELGNAAQRTVGLAVGNLVEVLADGKLPVLDASNLTNLPLLPPGTIVYCAAATPPPIGRLLAADGSLLLRATYDDLFDRIGEVFGVGDGSTTFRIPDLRGVFIRGIDAGRGLDPSRVFGSYQADELKEHYHQYRVANSDGGSLHADAGAGNYIGWGVTTSVGGTETRPKNIALLPCIAY